MGHVDVTVVMSALERVLRVPDAHRRFTETAASLARLHQINGDLLGTLLDGGLPHRGTGDERTFDRLDLENIALSVGVGPRWRAMRWWSSALSAHDPGRDHRHRIKLTAFCPEPGHPGACDFVIDARLVEAIHPAPVWEAAPGSYAFDVCTVGRRWFFGEPYKVLMEAATTLVFHVLPPSLRGDLGFLRDTGLANCRLATPYLAELGEELGLRVRAVRGLFVAAPYSVRHSWIDIKTEQGWFAADPFLIGAFHRWGIVDRDRWPANRSPHGLLWPLDTTEFLTVLHAGRQARLLLGVESPEPDGSPLAQLKLAGE